MPLKPLQMILKMKGDKMTVKELKEMLQDLPDDDIILLKLNCNYNYRLYKITRDIMPNQAETVTIEIEEVF